MTSVITLTHNNFEDLLKTLNSLDGASGIESIIINGGTCPRTLNFLKSYIGKSISEPDSGIADAFNKGIALSRGDKIAFLNSGDVLIDKNYYAAAEQILDGQESISYVYADLWFDDQVTGRVKFSATQRSPFKIGAGMPFPHPTLIVKKQVFDVTGHFNTSYRIAMDYEWTLRMLKSGYKGHYLPNTPILMDGRGVSSISERKALEECRRALFEQSQFAGKTRTEFKVRFTKFWIRYWVLRLLGKKALKVLKYCSS